MARALVMLKWKYSLVISRIYLVVCRDCIYPHLIIRMNGRTKPLKVPCKRNKYLKVLKSCNTSFKSSTSEALKQNKLGHIYKQKYLKPIKIMRNYFVNMDAHWQKLFRGNSELFTSHKLVFTY
jgi:hypothetical protein